MWTLTGSYACVPVSWLGLVTWPMYRKKPERQMWFSCICSLYGGHVHACAHGGQRSAILLLFSTLLFEIGLSVNLELTNLRISRPAHLRGPRAHFSSGRHCRCVVSHPASSHRCCGAKLRYFCLCGRHFTSRAISHEAFVAPTKVGRYSSGGQIDAWLQSEVFMAVFQTKKSSWRSVLWTC